MSDIGYHFNLELSGRMGQDLPWGASWSSGRGRLYYLLHFIVYWAFGIGLIQARMITILTGILLLFCVYRWIRINISAECAFISTVLVANSLSFWPFLSYVSQDMLHCFIYFLSFALVYNANARCKNSLFIIAGFCCAFAVEVSHRGIAVVAVTYLYHFISSDKNSIGNTTACMLLGSAIAFVIWFAGNVAPMGIDQFLRLHVFTATTEEAPSISKIIVNEWRRIAYFGKTQMGIGFVEIATWLLLFGLYLKIRPYSEMKSAKRKIIVWVSLVFIISSLMAWIDDQTYPYYMVLYIIAASIFGGMVLNMIWNNHQRLGGALIGAIMLSGLVMQAGNVVAFTWSQGAIESWQMKKYFLRLQSNVPADARIFGECEFWYAFPEAYYYGGGVYLERVKSILKELKNPADYTNQREKEGAFMGFLAKRNIEYLVLNSNPASIHEPNPAYLKEKIAQYFKENCLPEFNFMRIDAFQNDVFWTNKKEPSPHRNIEVYRVVSYEVKNDDP